MSGSIQRAKQALRRDLGARRRAVLPAKAAKVAEAVASALMGCERALRARRIGLYAALPDELPSRPLFDAVVESRAEAWLPRMIDGPGLEFASVARWSELGRGRFGVLEPTVAHCAQALGPEDVVVVPGVAFDVSGNRLGRGGGYYDAAFPQGMPAPWLVGLAYEFQVVEEVPHDGGDRRVDALATERGVRCCGGSNA